MRLSTNPNDKGYKEWLELDRQGKFARVFLEGVVQPDYDLADTDKGYVRIIARDDTGSIVRDDEVMVRKLFHGEVRIEVIELPPDEALPEA